MRVHFLSGVLALCVACTSKEGDRPAPAASTDQAPSSVVASSICNARLVTGDSMGPFHIGVALDSVRKLCPVVRDTSIRPDTIRPPERQVSFLLGTDTAVATIMGARVWTVELAGSRFLTTDSLGVGTTLGRLLRFGGVKGYFNLGHAWLAVPARCGLAFSLAGRFNDVPNGVHDSTVLNRLPPSTLVDRVRMDGCDHDDEQWAADDSTYSIGTDSTFIARDLDGNGHTDFVVLESRPYHKSTSMFVHRLAIYLDSMPASRRATWATGWDMEMENMSSAGDVWPMAPRGSLVAVYGSGGDYTSETLLAVREGKITVEMEHGEDYGEGFLEITNDGGRLVVDASQSHVMIHGQPVTPELECPNNDWAAVRTPWDESKRRFVPDKPRCIKPRWPDQADKAP